MREMQVGRSAYLPTLHHGLSPHFNSKGFRICAGCVQVQQLSKRHQVQASHCQVFQRFFTYLVLSSFPAGQPSLICAPPAPFISKLFSGYYFSLQAPTWLFFSSSKLLPGYISFPQGSSLFILLLLNSPPAPHMPLQQLLPSPCRYLSLPASVREQCSPLERDLAQKEFSQCSRSVHLSSLPPCPTSTTPNLSPATSATHWHRSAANAQSFSLPASHTGLSSSPFLGLQKMSFQLPLAALEVQLLVGWSLNFFFTESSHWAEWVQQSQCLSVYYLLDVLCCHLPMGFSQRSKGGPRGAKPSPTVTFFVIKKKKSMNFFLIREEKIH